MIYATYRTTDGDWQQVAAFATRKNAIDVVSFHSQGREWYMSKDRADLNRLMLCQETEADRIKIFLSGKRLACFSVVGLETASGIPANSLRQFLDGARGLPEKYIEPITKVLAELCWRNW